MSMTFGERKDLTAEMNVTPMIDVLLVLIIIFLLVTPKHSFGEHTEVPQPRNEDVLQHIAPDVVLELHEQAAGQPPQIRLGEHIVQWELLEAELQAIYISHPNAATFIKGDPEIDFEFVANAVDISRRAGAERVGLIGTN